MHMNTQSIADFSWNHSRILLSPTVSPHPALVSSTTNNTHCRNSVLMGRKTSRLNRRPYKLSGPGCTQKVQVANKTPRRYKS